jgi:hypothetical protein
MKWNSGYKPKLDLQKWAIGIKIKNHITSETISSIKTIPSTCAGATCGP